MQPTPQQAVLRGHLTVSLPVVLVTALVAAFARWYMGWNWFGALILGVVASWPVWAFLVPRWRDWVEESGLKGSEVQGLAVGTGLIWPTGFPLARTEFPRRNGTIGWSSQAEAASAPAMIVGAESEDELRAFIGPNWEYYLPHFAEADPGSGPQKLGWNWAAFFLNLGWLLYRRMFAYFWAATGILLVLSFLAGFLALLVMGVDANPPGWIDRLVNIAVACFVGAFGNWLYYRHVLKKLGQVRETGADRPGAIARAGGVSWLWPIVSIVVGIVITVFAAMAGEN